MDETMSDRPLVSGHNQSVFIIASLRSRGFVRPNRAAKKIAKRLRDNTPLTARVFIFSTKRARFLIRFSRSQRADCTDGEPMIFAFGNATRSKGKFHRITFGDERKRWISRSIDSRNCAFSNKELIAEWIADRGEDSDFVRVRVKGIPPRADDSQFIDMDRILAAQRREVAVLGDEPLICGVDLSWGGDDKNVVRFRTGNDARSIPPLKIPGESTRDPAVMVVKLTGHSHGHAWASEKEDSHRCFSIAQAFRVRLALECVSLDTRM